MRAQVTTPRLPAQAQNEKIEVGRARVLNDVLLAASDGVRLRSLVPRLILYDPSWSLECSELRLQERRNLEPAPWAWSL